MKIERSMNLRSLRPWEVNNSVSVMPIGIAAAEQIAAPDAPIRGMRSMFSGTLSNAPEQNTAAIMLSRCSFTAWQ